MLHVCICGCMTVCMIVHVCTCMSFLQATKPEHAVICVWDVESWKQLPPLPYHTLTIIHLTFSHSSHLLLATSRDRCWSLWKRNGANNRKKYVCNVCRCECIIILYQLGCTHTCPCMHTHTYTHNVDEWKGTGTLVHVSLSPTNNRFLHTIYYVHVHSLGNSRLALDKLLKLSQILANLQEHCVCFPTVVWANPI